MRTLVLFHRWLGVAFCLLFAMWFASGIVMHFIPFPSLSESERVAGLLPIDLKRVAHGPVQAVVASGIEAVVRVRVVEREDGPVYVLSSTERIKALRATDLADASVRSAQEAAALSSPHVHRGGSHIASAPIATEISADQWTIGEQYNPHRPMYRIALNDPSGTERYLSGTTGEIVLTTTRDQRRWNYFGSIAHWIYPEALRRHPDLWTGLVWWVALLASISACLGAVIGVSRIERRGSRPASPYRGWQAWHHWLGLICMPFILTWIVSGWLSMDDSRFSRGETAPAPARAITGEPDWQQLPADELRSVPTAAAEVEWFAFGGRIYRRERLGPQQQRLAVSGTDANGATTERAFLRADEIDSALLGFGKSCNPAFQIEADDAYATASKMTRALVFRAICGNVWLHIDGSNGSVIERLDPSRRVYRWLFAGLHRLDFPILTARPALRTSLIVLLCSCGLIFSLTGIVIAQRPLRSLRNG
jgi:hypothetical protein